MTLSREVSEEVSPWAEAAVAAPNRRKPVRKTTRTFFVFNIRGSVETRRKNLVYEGLDGLILAQAGLAESIAMLEQDLLDERASTDEHVSRLARPGLIPPLRAFHYFSALGVAQLGWAVRRLPQDLTDGLRPMRQPSAWLSHSSCA